MKEVLDIPIDDIHAWTDSTIVLSWLEGSPRRFKTYVGNRVSRIIDVVPPNRWGHVMGQDNPADCASRGILPSQLVNHPLWWTGPDWLQLDPEHWPKPPQSGSNHTQSEADELCIPVHVTVTQVEPTIPLDSFSSFSKFIRVTAWIICVVSNCQAHCKEAPHSSHCLSVAELKGAERYWISFIQKDIFQPEIKSLKSGKRVSSSSSLKLLNPFIDDLGLLRVGGIESVTPRDRMMPSILSSCNPDIL